MGAAVEQCDLPEAIEFLLRRESTAFAARWEALTKNQQRFLRGLATEAPGVAAFSAEFVQAYRLKTPSNAQRAAEALLKLELIDRKDGSFVVTDRFFGLWLRRPL